MAADEQDPLTERILGCAIEVHRILDASVTLCALCASVAPFR